MGRIIYMDTTLDTPPFDPDYAGIGYFHIGRAYSEDSSDYYRDIPERFVYDAPMDEWGLAEMAGPERDAMLDLFDEVVAESQMELLRGR